VADRRRVRECRRARHGRLDVLEREDLVRVARLARLELNLGRIALLLVISVVEACRPARHGDTLVTRVVETLEVVSKGMKSEVKRDVLRIAVLATVRDHQGGVGSTVVGGSKTAVCVRQNLSASRFRKEESVQVRARDIDAGVVALLHDKLAWILARATRADGDEGPITHAVIR
jgi:hypothetical protein